MSEHRSAAEARSDRYEAPTRSSAQPPKAAAR
jgi:hypothetical protein